MNGVLFNDCFDLFRSLDNNSVQLVLTDPPYAETGNKWDKWLDFQTFFWEVERVLKDGGVLAMTSTVRLASKLIPMADHLYKYDWIWVKDNGTNAPNTPYQPFRVHELVLIFGKGRVTNGTRQPLIYNPQKTEGKAYVQKSGKVSENWKGGLKNIVTENTGDRHPLSVQYFTRDRGLHPTQKPLAMMEYFVKTYSNENDLVVDPFAGSGTTLLASKNLNRKYLGAEKQEKYRSIIEERLKS